MKELLNSTTKLTKIGQGFCGTVWAEETSARDTTTLVVKRADGGPGRSLPNEQYMHLRILAALQNYKRKRSERIHQRNDGVQINVPDHVEFLEPSSPLWSTILPRLPNGFAPCEALVSERIPPMSLPVRQILSSHYCPDPRYTIQMAHDESNKSCLIRPYLGRRRPEQHGDGPRQRFFSLRNFPLHIDQIEDLHLPAEDYASAMADALAFLHWTARVDAGDVEYVLASPRPSSAAHNLPTLGTRDFDSEELGRHDMWILDFDCCRELEMNATGMRRAAMCFWRNDPFYPRPGAQAKGDQQLWTIFEERFLKESEYLLEDESEELKALPGMLMRIIRDNRDTWTKGAIN